MDWDKFVPFFASLVWLYLPWRMIQSSWNRVVVTMMILTPPPSFSLSSSILTMFFVCGVGVGIYW